MSKRVFGDLWRDDGKRGGNEYTRSSTATSRMRIAQVAPMYERVPPRLYGRTERVVSN